VRASSLSWRQAVAIAVGNGLEFYDFVTYAFFATQIGHTFFPSKTPGLSLLSSLATFGVGFLTRRLGAIVIGRYGDRAGRKPAMMVSLCLIGVALTGLALTPSYAAIGTLAPILVIMFRLLQGFALGGEVGPSTAFMLEAAPPSRRGLYASLQATSADAAALIAGLVGVALASSLDGAQLDAWGWRIALLLGVCIIPFAFVLRRTLTETLTETLAAPAPADAGSVSGPGYVRVFVLGLIMLSAGTTNNYVLEYMTTYASNTLGMPAAVSFGATAALGASGLVCDTLGGWLSDRIGRKPVMIIPWVLLILAIYPSFWILEQLRTRTALLAVSAILNGIQTLSSATIIVTITESLPKRVRSGAFALIYALAISVFGGSTQFLVALIIHTTGNPLAPAWYMLGAVTIGLIAMFRLPETAPSRRKQA
jgi:MHS family citrate/tricarballylate:H+ symporter-like MFS transporter